MHYANYQRWMERAHTEWWFLRGLRFDELPSRLGVAVVTRAFFTMPEAPPDHAECGGDASEAAGIIGRCSHCFVTHATGKSCQ